jgi:hypothetical protein
MPDRRADERVHDLLEPFLDGRVPTQEFLDLLGRVA